MTRQLDITRDVCPMTTVKVGMTLARLARGEELQVLVREEALRNVAASLKSDGHRIEEVGRREEFFELRVVKGGAGAGGPAAHGRPPTAGEQDEEAPS